MADSIFYQTRSCPVTFIQQRSCCKYLTLNLLSLSNFIKHRVKTLLLCGHSTLPQSPAIIAASFCRAFLMNIVIIALLTLPRPAPGSKLEFWVNHKSLTGWTWNWNKYFYGLLPPAVVLVSDIKIKWQLLFINLYNLGLVRGHLQCDAVLWKGSLIAGSKVVNDVYFYNSKS